MMYYPCLWLALTSVLHWTAQADTQLGFRYDGVVECSSSEVTIESLAVDCDTTTGCLSSEEITITGEVTTTLDMANEVNLKVKACKFWGYMCVWTLLDDTVNLCDIFSSETEDDSSCAPAGAYDVDKTITLPAWGLMNNYLAVNGITFRLYATIDEELTCHAQFTTVRSDSTYTAMSFLPLGLVALLLSASGWSIYQRQKNHRQTQAPMPTNHDHYVTM
jgi:hypothetical protein